MLNIILGLLGSLTLGNPDYAVRHGSFRAVSSHPYLAAVVSVAASAHPDAEVRRAGQRLWSPRLATCFFLTCRRKFDTIPEDVRDAGMSLGLATDWEAECNWVYVDREIYAERLHVKARVLMILPLTLSVR